MEAKRYGVSVPFGETAGGDPVSRLVLGNGVLECEVLTYGASLAALRRPGRDGGLVDVALGFDTLKAYEAQDKFMGAVIGRYANRIGGARFALGGREYRLAANEGDNHLHGGPEGFHRQVWTVEALSGAGAVLSLTSPDEAGGYPGGLKAWAAYTLDGDSLILSLRAVSDRDTLCSLTGHGYFNLGGHGHGTVLDHTVQIFSDCYTPLGAGGIPTGELAPVAGTPLDLRNPTLIGDRVDDPFPQLRDVGGYDHNFVLRGGPGVLRPAARVACPGTGIAMELSTTLPGLQFYTGNSLAGAPAGKGGVRYTRRGAFCLEPQFFPDAPNRPGFPQPVLRAGQVWEHTIRYRLTTGEA